MITKMLKAILFLALVLAGVAWLSGGFGTRISSKESRPSPTPSLENMEQTPVESVASKSFECASGVLESSKRTTISSRILARIEKVLVVAGDYVSAGDIVVQLDSRDLESRVKQTEQLLQGSQAERDLAVAEEKRNKTLLDQGIFTRQQYDQVLSNLRTTAAQVERMAQNLDEAKTALSYSVIKTPVTGRVVDRLAEPGDTASPGVPLLRIYDPSKLRVEAPVRESLAVRLRVGDPIHIQIVSLDQQMVGTISEIVPFSEAGTRTMLVKVTLPADRRLVGGMFARIAIPTEKRIRLFIPAQAVEMIGQLEFVAVIDQSGKIERRLVTTGEKDSMGRIEILSGLLKGEKVAWNGSQESKPALAPQTPSHETLCQ